MDEIWKPIPGYEGHYEASDQGNVRSLDRELVCSGRHKGTYVSRRKGRLLSPGKNNTSGHVSVVLALNGRHKTHQVHELVLWSFLGPRPHGLECCHNNGDPSDNRLINLRWDTRASNNLDKVKHGVQYKLSVDDVKEIKRSLIKPYFGLNVELAKRFNVSHVTISGIKAGRQHAWVSPAAEKR